MNVRKAIDYSELFQALNEAVNAECIVKSAVWSASVRRRVLLSPHLNI